MYLSVSGESEVKMQHCTFIECKSSNVAGRMKWNEGGEMRGWNVWIECSDIMSVLGDEGRSKWEGTISEEMESDEEEKFWVRELDENGSITNEGSLFSLLYPDSNTSSSSLPPSNTSSTIAITSGILAVLAVCVVVAVMICFAYRLFHSKCRWLRSIVEKKEVDVPLIRGDSAEMISEGVDGEGRGRGGSSYSDEDTSTVSGMMRDGSAAEEEEEEDDYESMSIVSGYSESILSFHLPLHSSIPSPPQDVFHTSSPRPLPNTLPLLFLLSDIHTPAFFLPPDSIPPPYTHLSQ